MGLLKTIPLGNSGIEATYWNVSAFNVDFVSNIPTVKLSGYIDKAHRLAGNSPVMHKNIRWVGAQNPITQTLLVQGLAFTAAYTKLITYNPPAFSGEANPFLGAMADL